MFQEGVMLGWVYPSKFRFPQTKEASGCGKAFMGIGSSLDRSFLGNSKEKFGKGPFRFIRQSKRKGFVVVAVPRRGLCKINQRYLKLKPLSRP